MNRNGTYRDVVKKFDRVGQSASLTMSDQQILTRAQQIAAEQGQAGCNIGCNIPDPANSSAWLLPAGFDEFCLEECDVDVAETTICAPFTLTGIYVSPTVACHLSVRNLVVCRWQAFGNSNWIPADFFSCCEIDENAMWAVTVAANSKTTMEVRNDSKKTVKFKGAVKGAVCSPAC